MTREEECDLAARIREKLPRGIHLMPGVTMNLGRWYLYDEKRDFEIERHVDLEALAKKLGCDSPRQPHKREDGR